MSELELHDQTKTSTTGIGLTLKRNCGVFFKRALVSVGKIEKTEFFSVFSIGTLNEDCKANV